MTTHSCFTYLRVETQESLPPVDPRIIDVAILDMNHDWPNLGHDSIVRTIEKIAIRMQEPLAAGDLSIRVISYDVRRKNLIPEPGGRFLLYVGTGGPGHLDPRRNDGISDGTQSIVEDPAWEEPLFRLFDSVLQDKHAALFAVCHTFGVLCRWSGLAEPRLRGAEKGGKSRGIVENVLTPEGIAHPWFKQFSRRLENGIRFPILDSRLYDLVPDLKKMGDVAVPISLESDERGADVVLTMLEFARDASGMPRFFAVNHHPEVIDRDHVMHVLDEKRRRGEVTDEWYEERATIFIKEIGEGETESQLRLTSYFTFVAPLEYHLDRLMRLRYEQLNLPIHRSGWQLPTEIPVSL